jgi:hypothetical protein
LTAEGSEKMKVMLVGFGPFPGITRNHSGKIVAEIHRRREKLGLEVIPYIQPVIFSECQKSLPREIRNHKPDFVVLLGIKTSSDLFCIESVVLNVIHSERPDAAGETICGRTVIAGGERRISQGSTLIPGKGSWPPPAFLRRPRIMPGRTCATSPITLPAGKPIEGEARSGRSCSTCRDYRPGFLKTMTMRGCLTPRSGRACGSAWRG